MTTQEYNINAKIANLLGWQYKRITKASCGGDVYERIWFMPGFDPDSQTADWITENGRSNPPNYCVDLNAMAEAEKTLKYPKDREYVSILAEYFEGINELAPFATAKMRAESFLRVHNHFVPLM